MNPPQQQAGRTYKHAQQRPKRCNAIARKCACFPAILRVSFIFSGDTGDKSKKRTQPIVVIEKFCPR